MKENLTSGQIPELLRRYKSGRILLATHLRPDGDALGSLCGTLLLLHEYGYRANAILPQSVPDYYLGFLPERAGTSFTDRDRKPGSVTLMPVR